MAAKESERAETAHVAIVGGGLAGLVMALGASRTGHDVIVVDDTERSRSTLGETLEFSANDFLRRLGLEPNELMSLGIGLEKNNVVIQRCDAADFEIWPPDWFSRPPFWVRNEAIHINRGAFDDHLRQLCRDRGVEFLDTRVSRVVTTEDDRSVRWLETQDGTRIDATWYVDATGRQSRLFARTFGIERRDEGEQRMAWFAHVQSPGPIEDFTRLAFSTNRSADLEWSWSIPIAPDTLSVGTVQPVAEADRSVLARHFVQPADPATAHSATFTPFTHAQVSGENWMMIGDAAGMVDAVTSNGVTAALRTAESATGLVATEPGSRTARQAASRHYHAATRMIRANNRVSARTLHSHGLRRIIGLRLAVFVFAISNVLSNATYVRLRRFGPVGLLLHRAPLALARAIAAVSKAVSRLPTKQVTRADQRWGDSHQAAA